MKIYHRFLSESHEVSDENLDRGASAHLQVPKRDAKSCQLPLNASCTGTDGEPKLRANMTHVYALGMSDGLI